MVKIEKIKEWLNGKKPQFEILNQTSAGDMSVIRLSDRMVFHRFQMQPGPDKHTMYDIMIFCKDKIRVVIRTYDRKTKKYLRDKTLQINDL